MAESKYSPKWVLGSIDNAKELASNRRQLNEWLIARLVQIAAGGPGGAAGARAIDMLLGLPTFDSDEDAAYDVDAVAERYAQRLLLGKGYVVRPPGAERADESG